MIAKRLESLGNKVELSNGINYGFGDFQGESYSPAKGPQLAIDYSKCAEGAGYLVCSGDCRSRRCALNGREDRRDVIFQSCEHRRSQRLARTDGPFVETSPTPHGASTPPPRPVRPPCARPPSLLWPSHHPLELLELLRPPAELKRT